MGFGPGFFTDILLLVVLGATIYYVLRLHAGLNYFHSQRGHFDQMIAKLLSSIDQAEKAIQNLRQTSSSEGKKFERLVQESRDLTEELKILKVAAENIARRLEAGAEGSSRRIVQHTPELQVQQAVRPVQAERQVEQALPKVAKVMPDMPSFMVRDRKQEEAGLITTQRKRIPPQVEGVSADVPDYLQSQAERELYEALRANIRKKAGGGRA